MYQIAIARFGLLPIVFPAVYPTIKDATRVMDSFWESDTALGGKHNGDYYVIARPAGYISSGEVREQGLATTFRRPNPPRPEAASL